MAVLPETFWGRYKRGVPKDVIKILRKGSHVKVLVHAIGHKPTVSEVVWLRISQIVHKGKKNMSFVGFVNTNTGRSHLHGLHFGMMITFEPKHIIDVGMIRSS